MTTKKPSSPNLPKLPTKPVSPKNNVSPLTMLPKKPILPKGQLISKCPNLPKNQPNLVRISALASKKRSNKRLGALYTTNWMILV